MKEEYINNPRLRLKHLQDFAFRLRTKHILGEENPDYRKELEFILERCVETIKQVKSELFMEGGVENGN